MAKSEVHVALLRGINVGGKNLLPMKALAEMFVAAGCHDVRTYIQSGNVVFAASASAARKVPALVESAIVQRFGFAAPVQTRSIAELRDVLDSSPLIRSGFDPAVLSVLFLADAPDRGAVAALDPDRSPGDTFVVRGREIHVACPNGLARTKLTNAWFDARLRTISTGRNWRTLSKLVQLAGTFPSP